ncbi:MFS transporter [Tumebacillus permanentifrigoris]|uniref:Putative MFS family arabinose efflux permease n=1 Tax=Tumebacillus permanentifrigoris TaxID=378543 RepID=A0A316D4W8_9BACL|nr:MFS transporter [Tumebacillus permanentifrigoris]PWK07945.1 putative MFS family arabinose efflux permease [Tumebacillus permanentifrigoris]
MTAYDDPVHEKKQDRYLYQLLAGKTASDIGSFINMVAINLYVYVLTGSAFLMGLFMAVRLLGSFVAGFYSGVLADRFNRKTMMIVADIARFVLLMLLVVLPTEWHVTLVFIVSFGIGVFGSMFNVAFQASLPVIVGPKNQVRANALFSMWGSFAMVIGLVASGTLLGVVGYLFLFAIDAFTYLISALNLISLPIKTSESSGQKGAKQSFLSEVKFILGYLRLWPVLLALMGIRLLDTFGSAAHNVGMPVFATQLNPANPSLYMGFIWAVWAVGNFAGSRYMTKNYKANEESKMERMFGIGTFLMSLFFILVFAWDTPYLILPAAFLAGISDGVSAICYNMRLQQVPDERRGRVFGVSSTMVTVGFAVGMVICSPLFDFYRPVAVVGLLHGIPMVMALVFTIVFTKRWKGGALSQETAKTDVTQ